VLTDFVGINHFWLFCVRLCGREMAERYWMFCDELFVCLFEAIKVVRLIWFKIS